MILKLKPSLLLILLSILFFSCEKEYSLEGSVVGGTSVFTFTGAPGACTNAFVSGTYTVNTALDATDIVTVSVDVTAIGTYIISSSTVNGITFTGSGSFTATGAQTIILTGTGKPLASGPFSFGLGTNGCTFPVTVSSGGGSSGGTSVFTLSGAPGSCTGFTPAGTYAAGTALGAGNTVTISANVTAAGTYTIATNTVNGMSFTGAGNFTTTGVQPVVLTGTGTPIAGGTFPFTPGTNGCQFSIIVTGSANGSAVFTYGGAPGACTSATPAGTYTTGSALTVANTVAVSVNVATIGTYIISTPIVNGFSFSGSGSFASTGAQTVTLTGTGTPIAAGSSNFIPTNNGCSFPVTVVAGTVATDFIKCTIGGVVRNFNTNISGALVDPTSISFSGEEPTTLDPASFNITLKKSPSITTGAYNRASGTNINTYCVIVYIEGVTPTAWLSGFLPTASNFAVTVTKVTPTRIDGTFTGTIYSDPATSGGALSVTAGSFSVPY